MKRFLTNRVTVDYFILLFSLLVCVCGAWIAFSITYAILSSANYSLLFIPAVLLTAISAVITLFVRLAAKNH